MADLTSLFGNMYWLTVGVTVVSIVYSAYMLWVNWKQSKVLQESKKTNELLAKNNELLEKLVKKK